MSKLVERVAAKQLNANLDDNALHDPFQSAFCASHSTEIALIRVKNDIAAALDRKCTTILVLLDLHLTQITTRFYYVDLNIPSASDASRLNGYILM